jgi:glycine betaine/proline transport system permease protein
MAMGSNSTFFTRFLDVLKDWLENGIPLGDWVESFVEFLLQFNIIFDSIKYVITLTVDVFTYVFLFPPALIVILLLAALAYWSGKKGSLAAFTVIGLALIWNLGYWENMVYTLALVLTATISSILIGVPVGIISARFEKLRQVVIPILDFMQTMPAFVYLIPAVSFFSIGTVPGIIASLIFAMPPTIRLTILGIQQVPKELIEAADAFGSTNNQKLLKVQLPLARKTILAGINQTIMLALSMVVISSMLGAKGLGRDIFFAVSRIDIGKGFEAGLAIVIIAILLDRITQNVGNKSKQKG